MPNYQHNERILEREARAYWTEERIENMRATLTKKSRNKLTKNKSADLIHEKTGYKDR